MITDPGRAKPNAAEKSADIPRLHLGCGKRSHPSWINADLLPVDIGVHRIDVTKPLPFKAASMETVYHAHLLEHLAPTAGRRFIEDCYRVLRPGGVLRVTVPDLEQIAREYLSCLESAERDEEGAEARYDWIVLELLDQLVRTRSGGEMLRRWSQEQVPAENYIVQRIGGEYTAIRRAIVEHRRAYSCPPPWACPLSEEESSPEAEVAFRRTGEVHRWMYDRFSLKRLLQSVGFHSVTVMLPSESHILDWEQFGFEVGADGHVCKPDSIAIEGIKPAD